MRSHFSAQETQCRCGCGYNAVSADLLQLAEDVRALLGDRPMYVHSCCRCPKHNAEVGGAPKSAHLLGHAMDFHVADLTSETVYNILYTHRDELPLLGGLGLYSWGVHIDIDKAEDGHLRIWKG